MLVLLWAAAALPGLWSLPAVDRDESRFAQASRQMLESGTVEGWVVPRVQDRPRLNKPPLTYWAQAASAGVMTGWEPRRDAMWMYRLPSALALLGTVLAVWRLGTGMYDGLVGLLAAGLISTAPVFLWEARQARADQLLVMLTTVAMASLWRVWRSEERSWRWPLALWSATGLGVMTKGPITPMIVLLTAASLRVVGKEAWRGRMRWWLGAAVVAAMVGPWVASVAAEVGFETYLRVVFDETIGRSGSAKEGHWGPPGYHIVGLVVLFWPGAMLVFSGLWRAVKRGVKEGEGGRWIDRARRARFRRTPEAFLLAWAVPAWIVFELVGTKLPHYTMPLYPALAIVSARAVFAVRAMPWLRSGPASFALNAWVVVGLGLAAAPVALLAIGGAWVGAVVLGAVMCGLAGVLIVLHIGRRRLGAQVAAMAVMLASGIGLIGWVLPRIEAPWVSERVWEAIERVNPGGERPVGAFDYQEDSLVFLSRGRVERQARDAAEAWLREHDGGLAVVSSERAESMGTVRIVAGPIEGYNYSRGKRVRLVIVEAVPREIEEP